MLKIKTEQTKKQNTRARRKGGENTKLLCQMPLQQGYMFCFECKCEKEGGKRSRVLLQGFALLIARRRVA
jgi:hypothetical protein